MAGWFGRLSGLMVVRGCVLAGVLVAGTPHAVAVEDGMAVLRHQCSSCHNLTGPAPSDLKGLWARKGPDLFYAGNKYRREWLEAWLQKPTRIRPAGMFYMDHIRPGPKRDMIDAAGLPEHVRLDASQAKAVAAASTFDIVSPADRPTNNAIVDHTMSAALRGAITVLMNRPDADPKLGKGDNILLR